MKVLSNRFKWVVLAHQIVYLKDKPRAVRGGYMDKDGHRYVGRNVSMMTREMYEKVFQGRQ